MSSGLAQRSAGLAALGALAAGLTWAPAAGLVLAAATTGAFLTTLWPALLLAALALAVPFGPYASLAVAGAQVTVTPALLAWAALTRCAHDLALRRVWRPDLGQVWPLLPFLAILVASSWAAPDWLAAGLELARWLILALALMLAADLAGRHRAQHLVLAAILVAGAAEALVGTRQALAGAGPEAFALAGGRARAFGDFGQPNPFGGYMNMVWPLGLALALPYLGRRPIHTRPALPAWLRVLGLAAAGLIGLGLLLSWSRGAWLAAFVGGAAMGLTWLLASLRPPLRLRASLVVGSILTLGLAALSSGGPARAPAAVVARLASVAETFTAWDVADAEVSDANFATVERVAHWQAAVSMWAERPWIGQGPGHYERLYPQFRLPRWPDALGHAHNLYLHLAAETGLLGLAAYLLFWTAFALRALRAALGPRSPLQAALGLGSLGVLVALAFHSLTDHLYVHDMAAQVGLTLGLLLAAGGRR